MSEATTSVTKKKGRGRKETVPYPGLSDAGLTAVPTDWILGTHSVLKETDFSEEARELWYDWRVEMLRQKLDRFDNNTAKKRAELQRDLEEEEETVAKEKARYASVPAEHRSVVRRVQGGLSGVIRGMEALLSAEDLSDATLDELSEDVLARMNELLTKRAARQATKTEE